MSGCSLDTNGRVHTLSKLQLATARLFRLDTLKRAHRKQQRCDWIGDCRASQRLAPP